MFKRIFSNPSLLFLLAGNLYCIWYYEKYPDDFTTIVWIYWCQSVIIGFFNFLELQTLNKASAGEMNMNDNPAEKGCLPWFFLIHFGGFHLAYFIFLLIRFPLYNVQQKILLLGVAVFFIESIIGFMRHLSFRKTMKVNAGVLFFLPYLRIIPMHLMILLPAFLGIKPSLLFLMLKMAADILSFQLYHYIYSKRKEAASAY